MYKKLLVIVGIIISLVMVISLMGFAIIKRIDEAENRQTLAFSVLNQAEEIHSHFVKLNDIKSPPRQGNRENSRRAFWREYDQTLVAIDKLVAPLHNGECRACHTEFLGLSAKLLTLNNNLSRADGRRLSGSSQSAGFSRSCSSR
ncbi:MAG: hypothetical protein Q8J63_01110 [Candidatus Aquicultor sp.]|nr:hypothetical protein [Candidatus Aquicultor sp.]